MADPSFKKSSVSGNCHRPDNSPLSPRLERATLSPQIKKNTVRFWCRFARLGNLTGKSVWLPEVLAAHTSPKGQTEHFGDFGVQTQAPNSISACVKVPQAPAGYTCSRSALIRAFVVCKSMGAAFSVKRVITRSTLPSTAATGQSKQMDATAPAVYGPIPGSASQPS